LQKVIEEDEEARKLDDLYKQKDELEQEKTRLEKELGDIPPNSKSMANKKKKQNLEQELLENRTKLASISEKLDAF
jgi:hypothetical protein